MGGVADFVTGESGRTSTRRADDAFRQYGNIQVPNIPLEYLVKDKQGVAYQDQALNALSQIANSGYTDIDRAALEQNRREQAMTDQANRNASLESLQRRGISGGQSIASALQGSQSAANLANQRAMEIAAQGQQRRLQGVGMLGDEAARRRAANEEISKFNILNKQNILQGRFDNQMGLANAKANARIGAGNAYAGRQSTANQIGSQVVGAAGAALAMSDERSKTAVSDAEHELKEMFSKVEPVSFEYKETPGHRYASVMAQDLEKSPLGKGLVVENEMGMKMIDSPQATAMLLAAQKMIMDRLSKLEKEEEED